ncbi:Carbamate kinase [Vibrio aestuarianus]|nr:Carbamate kinase [Vibrio aestuarianus]
MVDLIERDWDLVITYGNGPQVGFILRRSELAEYEVDPVPVDYAAGDTQGAIPVPILVASLGYWLLCRNQSADSVISSH